MTVQVERDKALETLYKISSQHCTTLDELFLNRLAALGLVEITEPKTIEQRTTEIIERHATAAQSMHIVAGLKKAGLL
jgi:hypothetical protein